METLRQDGDAVEVRLTAMEVLALRSVFEHVERLPLESAGPQPFLLGLRESLRALHRSFGADW